MSLIGEAADGLHALAVVLEAHQEVVVVVVEVVVVVMVGVEAVAPDDACKANERAPAPGPSYEEE